MAMYIVTMEDE